MKTWIKWCLEAEDGEQVEPWVPVVGQRVRVRLSAECYHVVPQGCSICHITRLPEGSIRGHPDCLNGKTGTVIENKYDVVIIGHNYRVIMDNMYEWMGTFWHVHTFAAFELEPVDESLTSLLDSMDIDWSRKL